MKGNAIAILAALESGLQIVPDIERATGIARASIWARLHEFKRIGVVRPIRLRKTLGRGRNGEKYKRYLLIRLAGWREA
jgi:hypothetical protein